MITLRFHGRTNSFSKRKNTYTFKTVVKERSKIPRTVNSAAKKIVVATNWLIGRQLINIKADNLTKCFACACYNGLLLHISLAKAMISI
jgi:hypothetical protein